jgi:hypothetical protein
VAQNRARVRRLIGSKRVGVTRAVLLNTLGSLLIKPSEALAV